MSDEKQKDCQLEKLVTDVEFDVFKDYLRDNSKYHPVELPIDTNDWKEKRIRTVKISKFIKNPDENDIDNLCQLYQSFNEDGCNISLLFHHTNNGIELYFRIADTREKVDSSGVINAYSDRAERIIGSVFPGAEIKERDTDDDVLIKTKYVTSITNIASEKNDKYVSIESLFDTADEENYNVLLLAEPFNNTKSINECNNLCEYLSQISEYESTQVSSGLQDTITKNMSIAFVASASYAHSQGLSQGETKTRSNYSVKQMITRISKTLERIDLGKSIGSWKFATYVLSNKKEIANNVAHQYDAIVRGKESNGITPVIITWNDEEAEILYKYLFSNRHPKFMNNYNKEFDVAALINSLELAHAMNIPRKSIKGFPVTECAAFGRNVSLLDREYDSPKVGIGNIMHMRKEDGGKLQIDTNLLTSHVFMTFLSFDRQNKHHFLSAFYI